MAQEQKTESEGQRPAHIDAIIVAREAIIKVMRGASSGSGKMTCPVCKTGELWYTMSGGSKGHIGASCTTNGCVAWRE